MALHHTAFTIFCVHQSFVPETRVALFRPPLVHIQIVLFDEGSDLDDLVITKDTAVLHKGVTVAFDEKLCGTTLGELLITGVNVHTFDHTMGGKIEVVTANLELIILRHPTPPKTGGS